MVRRSALRNEPSSSTKISETLLEFVGPIIELWGPPRTPRHLEKLLMVAVVAWNGVIVADAGDASHLDDARRRLSAISNPAEAKLMTSLLEDLVERKRVPPFRDDRRMVSDCKVDCSADGLFHIHAEARESPGPRQD